MIPRGRVPSNAATRNPSLALCTLMKTAAPAGALPLIDLHPPAATFLEEVLAGLAQAPRSLPCKYFYDAFGSQLFDRICELDEYYPTRTELAIMERHVREIVTCLGPRCLLVEYGSGSSLKTRILLDHLEDPAGYVPIDISREHLLQSAAELAATYETIPVLPVCADYTQDVEVPRPGGHVGRVVVYFPGSTIGNLTPAQARSFLQRIAGVGGPGGGLLIGVDLKKDVDVLWAAYNDAQGVTAAFNKNLLTRINRELGADFDVDRFEHEAVYDPAHGRVEMRLVSTVDQEVHLAGRTIPFRKHERIVTEYSYKYSPGDFATLAASAGFAVERVWTDEASLFSVQLLVNAGG